MPDHDHPLAGWTAEQIAEGQRWVETWRKAGIELERIRVAELRTLDARAAIALLCGPPGAPVPPPRPDSGLIEQQRWFMKAARHS